MGTGSGRLQRLFDLVSVLRARGRTTVSELADDLGVSTRTVHRDLSSLTEAGVPVVTEPGRYGGISVLPSGRFPVSGLSTREKDLLQITGLDADRAAELGQKALAAAALGKISRTRQGQHSHRSAELSLSQVVTVDNRPWFSAAPGQETETGDVAALAQDVRSGNCLSIVYRRSGEEASEPRVVDPYGLLGRGGRWYLVADRDGSPRMYAVERLASWEVLDAPRRLRPSETLESVVAELARDLERPRETTVVTAELKRGSLDLARRIIGSRLVSVRDGCDDGDSPDTVRIEVVYTQVEGVRQLLHFGDDIEVTAPEVARQIVGRLARSVVALYGDDVDPVETGRLR
ncbi:MAG TPA: WYL domain-containing protein [Candidatus Corynebacterium avicola]|uniref:WYL domain-containing protein n=1 Tax=Candidatus Corynebacterium avicola TaxID=2838527 RepID=A0A9D1RMS3_9CORY|nr:WYL domain-containing protein [Candidatus Corynebacterium avicola]